MQSLLSLDPESALIQGQASVGGDVIHSTQPGTAGRHCLCLCVCVCGGAGVYEVEMADSTLPGLSHGAARWSLPPFSGWLYSAGLTQQCLEPAGV